MVTQRDTRSQRSHSLPAPRSTRRVAMERVSTVWSVRVTAALCVLSTVQGFRQAGFRGSDTRVRRVPRLSAFKLPWFGSQPTTTQKQVADGVTLDPLTRSKLQEYTRGGATPVNMFTFLRARAEETKRTTGRTVGFDKLVQIAAEAIPDERRRSMLLDVYSAQMRTTVASSLSKYGGVVPGQVIADTYSILVGTNGPSVSSGKSCIVDAVRIDGQGGRLKIKLSSDLAAMRREVDNTDLVRRKGGRAAAKSTIQVVDFLENWDRKGNHALVMEAGDEDLVSYVKRKGVLKPREVKRISNAVLDFMTGVERAGLVWTDLRPENLVVFKNGQQVKAIDLESAVEVGERPCDCSFIATPPEVAGLYVRGALAQARVEPSYDTWSFGTLLLWLATGGKTLWGEQPSSRVMQAVATLTPDIVAERIEQLVGKDARLSAVLRDLLSVDPTRRPSLSSVSQRWYFKSPV